MTGTALRATAVAAAATTAVAGLAVFWIAVELPALGVDDPAKSAAAAPFVVGMVLQRVGHRERSMTLVADGKHLMTDVWTSVGVLVAIALVALTGWVVLDPIIALAVGANILWTGYRLLRRATSGLLSRAIPRDEQRIVEDELARFAAAHGVEFAPLRTIALGRRRLEQAVMREPSEWTVHAAHDLARQLESTVGELLPETETIVHVEPQQDGAS